MNWLLFAIFLATCVAASSGGRYFGPGPWYRSLEKPRWNPPDWVFPTVWSILYILIAVAAARVAPIEGSHYAMAFFALQIALNTIWSPIFFGLRKLDAAFVVVLSLWLAVAATLVSFWQLDPLAGALFAPYLLWVTIAAALNFSVWRRNPAAATN